MTDFLYTDMLPLGANQTPYRLITTEGVGTKEVAGERVSTWHLKRYGP